MGCRWPREVGRGGTDNGGQTPNDSAASPSAALVTINGDPQIGQVIRRRIFSPFPLLFAVPLASPSSLAAHSGHRKINQARGTSHAAAVFPIVKVILKPLN